MLKIYLGQSGAGKTHCIKQDIIHYYLLPREGVDVYMCNGRKEEWKESIFDSMHVNWVGHKGISSLQPKENDFVIFDATDLLTEGELMSLMPVIIRLSTKTTVVISLMEYKEEYKPFFLNAEEICYMRLPEENIHVIPSAFIDDKDKHTLKNLGQQHVRKHYMIIYKDGRSINLLFPSSRIISFTE